MFHVEITKKQYIDAIGVLATKIKLERSYDALIMNGMDLLHITKNLVYDLFVYGYDIFFEKDKLVYDAYYTVQSFCRELNYNGFIIFSQ